MVIRLVGNPYLRQEIPCDLLGLIGRSLSHLDLGQGDVSENRQVGEEIEMLKDHAEAMAAGLPVVATRAGGIPEVVRDEVNGLLAASKDPISIAERLIRVLGDPGLRDAGMMLSPRALGLVAVGAKFLRKSLPIPRSVASLAWSLAAGPALAKSISRSMTCCV